ncbi:hypothetical protein BaRGS_00001138 [Batillaria attramentaria]|uniref:LIM zinc-binding domain-containing protein n=1 Tax=Batillaria attramentaria TaxID=370345 RepID=A0ABD0M620_9CAEN
MHSDHPQFKLCHYVESAGVDVQNVLPFRVLWDDVRMRDLNGGGAPGFSTNYETFSTPAVNPSPLQNAGGFNPSQQSFNAAPRPFGSQAPPPPAPAPFKPAFDDPLSQRTQNLSLSPGSDSPPPPPPAVSSNTSSSVSRNNEPDFRSVAEKYSEPEDAQRPSQHQSRTFKYLQDLMDSGKEPPKALKPSAPKALQARSVSPVEGGSGPGPAQVVGTGSKPGTVKAIMSQRYNTPIGLYSETEVMSQFEGQSKFLLTPEDGAGGAGDDDLPPPPPELELEEPLPPPPPPSEVESGGSVKYFPSETFKLVQEEEKGRGDGLRDREDKTLHSRSFLKLQQELNSSGAPPAPQFAPKPAAPATTFQPKPVPAAPAAKPWTPAAAPPPPPAGGPRPFGNAPPKPTGAGARRGRLGDAVVSNPGGTPGRIPVCSSCGSPIRGPFVTALGNCWCPDHFVCANPQCGTKLIDIGFVEDGGHLYCEKDYERYLAPHCKKCNGAIIGECVNALQATWHPECFLCTHCKQPIGGNQFHIEEGKPYCERDWAAMFQTMCAGCDFPIEPGDRWVEAMGKNFHSECFNCSTCQVSLEGQPFVARAGKAFCKKHAR